MRSLCDLSKLVDARQAKRNRPFPFLRLLVICSACSLQGLVPSMFAQQPGYTPTPGTFPTLNIGAGTAFCNNALATYAGGTLTMARNTTNYVFLVSCPSGS